MPQPPFLSRFTPSRTAIEILETIFVQRQELLQDAEERILEGVRTNSKFHLLFVGPRGCGKTHLVTLLNHRIRAHEDLRDTLRVAWLEEDETTTAYSKLLLRIHRRLHKDYPEEFPAIEPRSIPSREEAPRARILENSLIERLNGRILLVLVENLDGVLEGLGDAGQKAWRSFLQEKAIANTVATSQQLTDDISSRNAPFHGFFRTQHLAPLNLEQAVELLKNIARDVTRQPDLIEYLDTPTGRSRVRAISHLTGGNHRLYIILSEFITRESLDDLVAPFARMIDDLTPYYQDRIKSLSPQQREIIECLRQSRETFSVNRIADAINATSQTVSNQLKHLRNLGYVRKEDVGRESLYELAEPLMRLCVEVKENRDRPIRLFVDFLRLWYTAPEVEQRLQALPAEAVVERQYLQLALEAMQNRPAADSSVVDEIKGLEKAADEHYQARRFTEASRIYEKLIGRRPNKASYHARLCFCLADEGQHERALGEIELALGIKPDVPFYRSERADLLSKLGRNDDAIRAIEAVVADFPTYYYGWSSYGILLERAERREEALAAFRKACDGDRSKPYNWSAQARVLDALGRKAEALGVLDEAIREKFDTTYTWTTRASILEGLGRVEDAVASFDQAISLDPQAVSPYWRRGFLKREMGDLKGAAEDLLTWLRLGGADPFIQLQLGILLLDLGRYGQAIDTLMPIRGDEDLKVFHPDVLLAMAHLGANHTEGLDLLRRAEHPVPYFLFNHLVPISLQHVEQVQEPGRFLDRVVSACQENQLLTKLGLALIHGLRRLENRPIADETLAALERSWTEATRGIVELEMPLRLFSAGLRYRRTRDRRVLFELISEERSILEQALGLDVPGPSPGA